MKRKNQRHSVEKGLPTCDLAENINESSAYTKVTVDYSWVCKCMQKHSPCEACHGWVSVVIRLQTLQQMGTAEYSTTNIKNR